MLTSEDLATREGYLSLNEVKLLKFLTLLLPDEPIAVNIGAGMGTSALAMLESRDDVIVYSIDIHDGFQFGSLRREKEALQEARMWDPWSIRQIHGDSREVGRNWPHGKVDMIFVDNGHLYEECKGDIQAWFPHLKKGGIIAFHDYGGQYDIGVSKAVDEMMRDHERIAHIDTIVAFRKTT